MAILPIGDNLGKNLNWLFELRSIGDYGVTIHVPRQDAKKAVKAAKIFLTTIKDYISTQTKR